MQCRSPLVVALTKLSLTVLLQSVRPKKQNFNHALSRKHQAIYPITLSTSRVHQSSSEQHHSLYQSISTRHQVNFPVQILLLGLAARYFDAESESERNVENGKFLKKEP